jgi:cytochrome oxidase Cu insertion factor (SCO1/SenC/PrrC family)
MSLQEKLDEFKAKFESGGPPANVSKAVVETMHRATEELRQSGLAERALKVGARAPAFQLNNQDGKGISSAELLAKGPLVITFFRGHW